MLANWEARKWLEGKDMKIQSFLLIFSVNMAFMYLGFKALPLEQVALMAGAFTALSMGGFRLLKLR